MDKFINSLDISIEDPYYGGEILPDYIPYTDEATKFWNDPTCCIIPFELNLNRFKWDNEKGYIFSTKPCYCFNVIPKEYEIFTENLDEIINFEKLKILKNKIIKGDYSLCKKCPQYTSNINKITPFENGIKLYNNYGYYGRKIYEGFTNKEYKKEFDNPLILNLALDSKCNLLCPTCRNEDYDTYLSPLTTNDLNKIVEFVKQSYIVGIGCDGETFLNKSYMDILKQDLFEGESKLNKIIIYTNGVLANNTNFSKIHPNNIQHIKEIKISIDAATENTYNIVRPGGRWNTLLQNVNYLALHPQRNWDLHTTFTISKYNYKDIPDFIDFSFDLGFNKVLFSFARPLFHKDYSNSEYRSDFIIDGKHKEDITYYIKNIIEKYDGKDGKFVGLV